MAIRQLYLKNRLKGFISWRAILILVVISILGFVGYTIYVTESTPTSTKDTQSLYNGGEKEDPLGASKDKEIKMETLPISDTDLTIKYDPTMAKFIGYSTLSSSGDMELLNPPLYVVRIVNLDSLTSTDEAQTKSMYEAEKKVINGEEEMANTNDNQTELFTNDNGVKLAFIDASENGCSSGSFVTYSKNIRVDISFSICKTELTDATTAQAIPEAYKSAIENLRSIIDTGLMTGQN